LIVSPIVFFAATLPWRIEPHDVTFYVSLGAWYAVLLAVIAWLLLRVLFSFADAIREPDGAESSADE